VRQKPEEGHPGVVDSSWQNPYYNYQAPGLPQCYRAIVNRGTLDTSSPTVTF